MYDYVFRNSLIVFSVFLIVCSPLLGSSISFASDDIALTDSKTTQASSVQSGDRISGKYFTGYFYDTKNILTSPVDWNSTDWLKAGLVVGATVGLYMVDEDIKEFSQKHQGKAGDALASVGNALGDPLFTLPPLSLLYLYGHYYDDQRARQTSLLAIESVVIAGAFTMVLKNITQGSRPNTGDRALTFYGHRKKTLDSSFPSGHTTEAFAIASVFAEEYKDTSYMAPIAYSLATLTACARIYDNKHWASDVVFGGAVGYFVGKTIVRYHSSKNDSAVSILPTINHQSAGLLVQYRF